MTSYFVCLGKKFLDFDVDNLVNTLNPSQTLETKILNVSHGWFAVSFHANAPLKGSKYFEDSNWVAVFAGDLIEKSIPWEKILEALSNGDYKVLTNFNGYFSIAALSKKENRLFIISDRRSQFPVFYLIDDVNIYVSTELSTFFRLPIEIEFNIEWLWEYLFFNFPIGQTTFFKNVRRVPPASVLEIDIQSMGYSQSEYAAKFHSKKHLLDEKEALEYAYNVFKNTVPKYFVGASSVAVALTSGWDTRTNLCFSPNKESIVAYCYGVRECSDLVASSKIARALNIDFKQILFDEEFENRLPSLIFETVLVSSGLERITRASILHAYRSLTDSGKKYPLVISGINLDALFRGHMMSIHAPDMSRILSTGEKIINEDFWEQCIGRDFEPFKRHILKRIDDLERNYGKLSKPETHLSYLLYEGSTHHFAGEIAVAKHFTTVRVPAWDNEIIDLAYSIRNGALSFSQYQTNYKRGSIQERMLQAYMISKKGGPLREIPIHGIPPEIFGRGKIVCHLFRIKNLGPKRFKDILLNKSDIPLEDWNKWLNGVLKSTINKIIFSEYAIVKDNVHPEYLNSLKNKLSDPMTAKLATAEIVLKLFFEGNKEMSHKIFHD